MGENEKKYNEIIDKLMDKINAIEDLDTRYRILHEVVVNKNKLIDQTNKNSPKIKEMSYGLSILYLETAMKCVDDILTSQNSIRHKK